jgi:O-antigen ligase
MKNRAFLISTLLFVAVAFGQVLKISVVPNTNFSVNVVDLTASLFALFFLTYLLAKRQLKTFLEAIWSNKIWQGFFIFIIWALIALLLNSWHYAPKDVLTAFSYWGRFFAVFTTASGVYYLFKESKSEVRRLFVNNFLLWGAVLTVLGYVVLILFPDFSFMVPYGWDPHLNRLLSTFYDPNFFGGFLALVMAVILGQLNQENYKQKKILIFLLLLCWVALYLTYSRSAWFAGAITLTVVAWPKGWKLSLAILVAFMMITLIPNRLSDRFSQAGSFFDKDSFDSSLNLNEISENADPSAASRSASLKRALELGERSWLIGVGYNAYGPGLIRYNIVDGEKYKGRSTQGSDSSILNVFATTGIIGLVLFIRFLWFFGLNFFGRWRENGKGSLAGAVFGYSIGLFAASFFNNTLFYTLIFLPFLILAAVSMGEKATNNAE